MEIVYRDLSTIKPNPKNPRKPKPNAIVELAESIKNNPDYFEARPILLSDRTGELVIVGGERRSEAARYLEMEQVPTILIPNLTEERENELMILDNVHSGVWDEKMLESWDKAQLQKWGVELPKWDKPKKEVKEDDFNPEKKVKARCKFGELWQLGKHRLLCGDSTNKQDVEKLMGGGTIDLLLTDPPYNVDYSSKNKMLNYSGKGNCVQREIKNDSIKDLYKFLTDVFNNANQIMKNGCPFYIWYADAEETNFVNAVNATGWKSSQYLIWVKNNHILGRKDYQCKHEPCLYGWKKGAGHYFTDSRSETTILEFDKPLKSELHPTMKPVNLFAYLLGNSTKENEIVLDLFGGSGTTLIAAEQLNRVCYMMEFEPHYCDVIIERWEKFTGQKAKRIE